MLPTAFVKLTYGSHSPRYSMDLDGNPVDVSCPGMIIPNEFCAHVTVEQMEAFQVHLVANLVTLGVEYAFA